MTWKLDMDVKVSLRELENHIEKRHRHAQNLDESVRGTIELSGHSIAYLFGGIGPGIFNDQFECLRFVTLVSSEDLDVSASCGTVTTDFVRIGAGGAYTLPICEVDHLAIQNPGDDSVHVSFCLGGDVA